MLLRHLALAVTDEARSQAFYAGWFGFDTSARMDDGVLMLYGPGDVSLALGPAEGPPSLPALLHFGFVLDTPDAVRESRDKFTAAGVGIVDFWDEPDYVSVKVRDPDGCVVEVSWEPSEVRPRASRSSAEAIHGSAAGSSLPSASSLRSSLSP